MFRPIPKGSPYNWNHYEIAWFILRIAHYDTPPTCILSKRVLLSLFDETLSTRGFNKPRRNKFIGSEWLVNNEKNTIEYTVYVYTYGQGLVLTSAGISIFI